MCLSVGGGGVHLLRCVHACEVLFGLVCAYGEIKIPLHQKASTPTSLSPLFSHWKAIGFGLPLRHIPPPPSSSAMATCAASSISRPAPQPSQLKTNRQSGRREDQS